MFADFDKKGTMPGMRNGYYREVGDFVENIVPRFVDLFVVVMIPVLALLGNHLRSLSFHRNMTCLFKSMLSVDTVSFS
jgi:hypothetical protein